jgi:hypothetical protein
MFRICCKEEGVKHLENSVGNVEASKVLSSVFELVSIG